MMTQNPAPPTIQSGTISKLQSFLPNLLTDPDAVVAFIKNPVYTLQGAGLTIDEIVELEDYTRFVRDQLSSSAYPYIVIW